MKALFIGGFLGSGKTTVINRILRGMTSQGLRAVIIENELGEVHIDQAILDTGKAKITSLNGGCVCCELIGDLLSAIESVKKQQAPDWLIIETAGLAMLDSIKSNFELYGSADVPFYLTAIADSERFEVMWEVMKPLLEGQFSPADLILLSKTDVTAPSEALFSILSEIAPGTITINTAEMQDAKLWSAMELHLKGLPAHVGSR